MQVYNEGVGSARNAMTGKRSPGVPSWREAEFADGSKVADVYPQSEWTIKVISFKSPLQNSYSVGAKTLLRVVATNTINIGEDIAQSHDIKRRETRCG